MRDGDGERLVETGTERVVRGGSFTGRAHQAHCGARGFGEAGRRDGKTGVPPIRAVL